MSIRRTRSRSRKRPARKPFEVFLDNLTSTLIDLAGTAIFGGAAVLVGKALGTKPQRVELPPGLPTNVVDEWNRLAGASPPPPPKPPPPPRRHKREPDRVEEAEVVDQVVTARPTVQLVKGSDGVYRPG